MELPFDGYRWRWASLTPSEGLNNPAVFVGVLRALAAYEGRSPRDADLHEALQRVQTEAGEELSVGRTPDRNLIRNSGQYWKALGVLADDRGVVHLTPLGKALANAEITIGEFGATVIRTFSLPNPSTDEDSAGTATRWREAGLNIRPLELILNVMQELNAEEEGNGYVEPQELVRIIIPMAGAKASVADIAAEILERRRLDVFPDLPDCTPGANDFRMAREFLLFLWYYGYCRREDFTRREDERYYLAEVNAPEIQALLGLPEESDPVAAIAAIRESGDATIAAERRRVTREIMERTGQSRFRRSVLAVYGGQCALTGETTEAVLDACHIRPVPDGGPDHPANGICLRTDLHALFDKGYLRFSPDGQVLCVAGLDQSVSYGNLPDQVAFPMEKSREFLEWRWNYGG